MVVLFKMANDFNCFKYINLILLLSFILKTASESAPNRKIVVMISHYRPYAIIDTGSPKGADVEIMKQFALQHGSEIEFVGTNASLHEVFGTESNRKSFFNDSVHAYVLKNCLSCLRKHLL